MTRARDRPISLGNDDRLLHLIRKIGQRALQVVECGPGVVEGVEGHADDGNLASLQLASDEDTAEPGVEARPVPSICKMDEDVGQARISGAIDGGVQKLRGRGVAVFGYLPGGPQKAVVDLISNLDFRDVCERRRHDKDVYRSFEGIPEGCQC